MTSVLLNPQVDGVDGAGLRTLTNFSPVANAGYGWTSLYLGGIYGVTATPIEASWAAGLPVMLNYERSSDAAKGGYAAGTTAAQTAISQASALGFLGEAPLIFSGSDFNPTAAQMPAVLEYHRALVDVFTPAGWVGGAYGPRTVLSQLSTSDFWPDSWPLWHWGGDGRTIYPWAWAKQWYGKSNANPPHNNTPIGVTVDENTLLKPMRFWSGYGPDDDPIEPDTISEVDMALVILLGDVNGWWKGLDDQGYARSIYGPEANVRMAASASSKTPITSTVIPEADWNAWPSLPALPPTAQQVAAAVVAALPPGTTSITVDQVEGACELAVKTILEQTTYTSTPSVG